MSKFQHNCRKIEIKWTKQEDREKEECKQRTTDISEAEFFFILRFETESSGSGLIWQMIYGARKRARSHYYWCLALFRPII